MIVDFQHHFTPRELIKQDPGDRLIVHFDENDAPSYTIHSLLYDLDEHIKMMDVAGIDAAFLTMAVLSGMNTAITNPLHAPVRTATLAADLLLGRDAFGAAWIARHRALVASAGT